MKINYKQNLCVWIQTKLDKVLFFKLMHTFLLHNVRWSCSGLIFLPGSKEFRKKHPLNQEILLIFCSIPSKKIGNPKLPLLISASAQTISTPTENYLLSRLHREWRSFASSDTISSYSLWNSVHTFHIYCSFADKPSTQTRLWLPVTLLAELAGEN